VLRADEVTAKEYAVIRGELKRSGHPIPANDTWIAALARQYGMSIISRDEHFGLAPNLKRVSWSQPSGGLKALWAEVPVLLEISARRRACTG
jgi:predicted nucleic acid-binding protein